MTFKEFDEKFIKSDKTFLNMARDAIGYGSSKFRSRYLFSRCMARLSGAGVVTPIISILQTTCS